MDAVGKVANHIKDSHKECRSEKFLWQIFMWKSALFLNLNGCNEKLKLDNKLNIKIT